MVFCVVKGFRYLPSYHPLINRATTSSVSLLFMFKQRDQPTHPMACAPYCVFCRRHAAPACLLHICPPPVSCMFVNPLCKTFVGLTALLAAFPTCLGYDEPPEPTQPLLSGSVCRVRDSLDFLDVSALLMKAKYFYCGILF